MTGIVKFIIGLIVLTVTAYLSVKVFNGYVARRHAESRIQTIPDVTFLSLYGDSVNLRSFDRSRPLVVKYFHPDCEFCRYDASEMASYAAAFSRVQVVMITPDDSLQRVERFVNEYHLHEIDNIQFLIDHHTKFRETFGRAILPSVYIYGPDQKLAGRFLGETHPGNVLNLFMEMSSGKPSVREFTNPSNH
jgi:peroxiredoxin